jgi:hypothetical protein
MPGSLHGRGHGWQCWRALGVTGGRLPVWVVEWCYRIIIIGWDVVWVRLLVVGRSGHGSGHCRSKYLLGWNYRGICNRLLM